MASPHPLPCTQWTFQRTWHTSPQTTWQEKKMKGHLLVGSCSHLSTAQVFPDPVWQHQLCITWHFHPHHCIIVHCRYICMHLCGTLYLVFFLFHFHPLIIAAMMIIIILIAMQYIIAIVLALGADNSCQLSPTILPHNLRFLANCNLTFGPNGLSVCDRPSTPKLDQDNLCKAWGWHP